MSVITSKEVTSAAALETKEPKRTKESYEKLNFNHAWESVKHVENGGSFFVKKTEGLSPFWVEISHLQGAVADWKFAHERIETPIEWWEDANDLLGELANLSLDDDGVLQLTMEKGQVGFGMSRDKWCDFARILLEQELESDWQNGDRCNYGGVDGVVIGYCVDRKWIVIEHSGEVDTVEARLLEQGE